MSGGGRDSENSHLISVPLEALTTKYGQCKLRVGFRELCVEAYMSRGVSHCRQAPHQLRPASHALGSEESAFQHLQQLGGSLPRAGLCVCGLV